MFSQLCAIVWSALHYPSAAPLCSLRSASSSYDSCVSRFAHASSRYCSAAVAAAAAAVPLALIFQQRHSIRRRPCHRLLPEDPHPRLSCRSNVNAKAARGRGLSLRPWRSPSLLRPPRLSPADSQHASAPITANLAVSWEVDRVVWVECSLLMGPFEEPAARHSGRGQLR